MLGLPIGRIVNHIEPLNIIKNYYGEKYAIYFTFLAHHIGWLVIAAVPGFCMTFYQLITAYVERTED